ncbi:MAG: hypothetical protein R3B84_18990 [Zavarzinella sp.]
MQEVAQEKNTIILQFKTDGALGDWDRLIALEDTLIQAFSQNDLAMVDGHDFGNGTANIFIFPRGSWKSALTIIMAYLKHHNALDKVLIIIRCKSGTYEVVWPEGFDGEFEKL